ncbi:DUF6682 family protein [Desulfovibrio inopinatus]|uniref:phage adaptor protein n=1 Tax=Desulfovibrio inopinatus TaxID=102109 RepID=UPI0004094518|nr:DUF6682 family protein [Desulfovibrio inopinatus]
MARTCGELADDIRQILFDPTGIRWDNDEIMKWINLARKEICKYKPDLFVKTKTVILVAGTKQSLPSSAIRIVKVVRNMGTTGTSPGRSITLTDLKILENLPGWHAHDPSSVVLHWTFDDRSPKSFYIFPPQPATGQGYVEIIYIDSPGNLTISQELDIDVTYESDILNYVLGMCYRKDADFAGNDKRSQGHLNDFYRSMGSREQLEMIDDPNIRSAAGPRSLITREGK